ncbi:LpqB family beta-propeller domain-containing protein [Kytococcus sedentarius]|uniref:LpqB family beta-propeller domain-containing protein n=1 Tax=Kytococcus sedentarius TaxID=1276 RepID=UPI0035BBF2AF
MSPLRRTGRSLAAALAVIVGVTACSPIPQESAVERGPALNEARRQEISVEVEPPAPDATSEEIVAGFLRTGLDAEDNFRAGREYLTQGASASWQPDQRVLVHDERVSPGITEVAGNQVRVNLSVVGTVDASGVLTEAAPDTREDLTFEVEQVDGQWRISGLPHDIGVFLTQADFQRIYRPVDIHWGSPVSEELVPQARWLRDGEGLTSALGRTQVEQVPEYLEGAMHTGMPSGTRLEAAAVPVVEGVASIRLSEAMNEADGDRRNLAWAQFAATMRQLTGVEAVSLQAGGRPLNAASSAVGERLAYPQGAGYSVVSVDVPLVLLHQRQNLVAADPRDAELSPAPQPPALDVPPLPASWERMAVSTDFRTVGAVDGRQLGVWRDGRGTTHTVEGRLSVPSIDPLGFLWTTQRTDEGSEVLVLDATGSPTESQGATGPEALEVPWLENRSITQVRMSPDGARALVVLREAGRDQVAITGVVRGADGEPTSLAEPRAVVPAATAVRDLAWIDERSVAVLGEPAEDGEQQVWRADVGGWTEAQGRVDNAVAIAGYPDEREDGILITTDGGRVLTKAGATWFVASAASDVIVPGR